MTFTAHMSHLLAVAVGERERKPEASDQQVLQL